MGVWFFRAVFLRGLVAIYFFRKKHSWLRLEPPETVKLDGFGRLCTLWNTLILYPKPETKTGATAGPAEMPCKLISDVSNGPFNLATCALSQGPVNGALKRSLCSSKAFLGINLGLGFLSQSSHVSGYYVSSTGSNSFLTSPSEYALRYRVPCLECGMSTVIPSWHTPLSSVSNLQRFWSDI